MKFLTNPAMKSVVDRAGKHPSKKSWRASGFRRNPRKRSVKPSPKQLAARKKFAAMARARAREAGKTRRAQSGSVNMAATKRRRKEVGRPSVRRRGHRSRGVTVRRTEPVAHRRRRRYRRNPPIVTQVTDLGMSALYGVGGMAVGGLVGNAIPFTVSDPKMQSVVDFVKGLAVAAGIRIIGAKALGEKNATIAGVGALIHPTLDLITTFVPEAAQYLGAGPSATFLPAFPNATRQVAAYPGGVAAYALPSGGQMGSYSGGAF